MTHFHEKRSQHRVSVHRHEDWTPFDDRTCGDVRRRVPQRLSGMADIYNTCFMTGARMAVTSRKTHVESLMKLRSCPPGTNILECCDFTVGNDETHSFIVNYTRLSSFFWEFIDHGTYHPNIVATVSVSLPLPDLVVHHWIRSERSRRLTWEIPKPTRLKIHRTAAEHRAAEDHILRSACITKPWRESGST